MTAPSGRAMRKVAAWSVAGLVTVVVVLISLTVGWRPVLGAKARQLTARQFERTPERLARGKYLVEGVVNCYDCHSGLPSQPPTPGVVPVFTKEGAGRVFIEEGSLRVVAPNITPDRETGAGSWTDDQIARAIREGIGHDGRTLFPAMPYADFRYLSDEDMASIIVYLRSGEPIHNELPKTQVPFPLSRLINSGPEPVNETIVKTFPSAVERGRYLTQIASCGDCHTPVDKAHRPLPGMEFAGGAQIEDFPAASANITPDASGIGYYDEALFIKAMRTGHVGARALNPPMPWWNFRNMTDDDLKALFAYLRTVKPVHHRVDNTETATKCKVCNGNHGAGAENGG